MFFNLLPLVYLITNNGSVKETPRIGEISLLRIFMLSSYISWHISTYLLKHHQHCNSPESSAWRLIFWPEDTGHLVTKTTEFLTQLWRESENLHIYKDHTRWHARIRFKRWIYRRLKYNMKRGNWKIKSRLADITFSVLYSLYDVFPSGNRNPNRQINQRSIYQFRINYRGVFSYLKRA